MTTYQLCIKLGKILSKHYKLTYSIRGILRTARTSHRDVMIDVPAVHKSLKESIEEVKRKSEKTISMLQEAIDVIEGLSRKQ